jgi:hypothetical protein
MKSNIAPIHKLAWVLSPCVAASSLSWALGQQPVPVALPTPNAGAAVSAPIQNWTYLGHSSSIVEGSLRGQAALASSLGEATYMQSLAAVNYAEAQRRVIDNSLADAKSWYERQEMRREYLDKYGPKAFVGESRKLAIERSQPRRLSSQEFNSTLAKLTWPHILRQEQFTAITEQIDAVFLRRSPLDSGDGSPTHRELIVLCRNLHALIKDNKAKMTGDQYIQGLEFIRSVEFEGRMPTSIEAVAKPETQVNQQATDGKENAMRLDADHSKLVKAKY